jgi:hypothetical protein
MPDGRPQDQFYFCSAWVVAYYLGREWLERYLISDEPMERGYLRRNTHEEDLLSDIKLLRLAELLINLQFVKGFWSVVETLYYKGPEIGYSELSSGQVLKFLDIEFSFRTATGVRGQDYDLDICVDCIDVCGETKCKIEDNSYSSNAVRNSVDKARRVNLPNDKPGIVFAHVPETWGSSPTLLLDAGRALDSVFRSSGRLIGVIIIQSFTLTSGLYPVPLTRWEYFPNDNTRFKSEIFSRFDKSPVVDSAWVDLATEWGPFIHKDNYEGLASLNKDLKDMVDRLIKDRG